MRIARVYVPGVAHHVITRLVDRRFYFDMAGARDTYLSLLGRSLEKSDWRCFAYALMSNHIHLLLLAGEEQPERWLKRVHSPFGLRMNDKCEGLGPIIADRPKMHIVPDADVGRVVAYIHNNPVNAGVVTDPAASAWTSHRAYVGHSGAPAWLDTIEGMRRCGFGADPDAFDRWVRMQPADLDPVLEGERIIRAARSAKSDGSRIATPVLGASGYAPRIRSVPGRASPRPEAIVAAVCRVLGVRLEDHQKRGADLTQLRRLSVNAGPRLGCSIAVMSSVLGVSRQYGARLAAVLQNDDELVLRLVAKQLRSVDEVDTVPIQVSGKIGRRAGRS
jgi:REP element-mobilizing transposase RayT